MMLPTFNVPPIGPRQGKLWGTTQMAFAYNGTEAHAITVEQGGYCSRHFHEHKWNRFLVLSGKLAVRIFWGTDDNKVDETVLMPGQVTDVPPGVRHEFEGLEDTLAVEFYWTVLDAGDIDREGSQGGMKGDS